MSGTEHVPTIKVVLLGGIGIGAKTSLIARFVNDVFGPSDSGGIIPARRQITVRGVDVMLEMWGLYLLVCPSYLPNFTSV